MDEMFRYVLPEPTEYRDFMLWAFGWWSMEGKSAMRGLKKWNQLHGKQLRLEHDGDIAEDVVRMVDLWRHEMGVEDEGA